MNECLPKVVSEPGVQMDDISTDLCPKSLKHNSAPGALEEEESPLHHFWLGEGHKQGCPGGGDVLAYPDVCSRAAGISGPTRGACVFSAFPSFSLEQLPLVGGDDWG